MKAQRTNRFSVCALVAVAAMASTFGCKREATEATPGASASPSASAAPPTMAPTPTASASAAPPPADEGVKVPKKPPTVGTKFTEQTKSTMALAIKAGAKNVDVNEDENITIDEEVLAVSGDAATKLKVTFTTNSKVQTSDGKAKTKKSDLQGKTFILAQKDGKTVVLNEKEKPASANDAKAVLKQFSSFGKPDPVLEALPARALKPGEKIPEMAEAVKKSLKGEGKDKEKESYEDATVTFKGKEGDKAVFNVAVTLKLDGPLKMSIPFTGTYSLRAADGAPLNLTLEGPVTLVLTDKDKAQGFSGGGKLKIAVSTTFK